MPQQSAVNVVFGAGSFGKENPFGAGFILLADHAAIQHILDAVKAHGHHQLDTARVYVCISNNNPLTQHSQSNYNLHNTTQTRNTQTRKHATRNTQHATRNTQHATRKHANTQLKYSAN
jgi:hypothetical protein